MKHYIHAGWLIDGTGVPIQKDVLLTITDGKWERISPMVKGELPEHAAFTDLSHCTVVPPLIDGLAYLSLSATTNEQERLRQHRLDYSQAVELIQRHMGYLFTHGVFLVREGGDIQGYCRKFADTGEGNHPVQLKVRERDWIYLRCLEESGECSKGEAGLDCTAISPAELRLIVEKYSRQGTVVVARVSGGALLRKTVEAGCRRIDYLLDPSTEDLQYMADKGVFWRPHLLEARERLDCCGSTDLQTLLSLVATARECGVKMVVGTGAGNRGILHGESMVETIKLFMKTGYSLSEAIACATENSARFLGVDQEFGKIETGRVAHFLVARGTPSQLPRKLAYLEAIYYGGIPCSSMHYRKI